MDFIMPAYKKIKYIRLWLVALLLLGTMPALAEFNIKEIEAELNKQVMIINGSMDTNLTEKVEEALSKGIPLSLILEIDLYRSRAIIWDKLIAEWSINYQVLYHALSGQYLVNVEYPEQQKTTESFFSLQEALVFLSVITDLNLTVSEKIFGNESYETEIRIRLDIESLPTPLRPVAYTTSAWHLNSGWTRWPVQH